MSGIESLHQKEYGRRPAVVASAPGVVNLMGSYTEAAHGCVLLVGVSRRAYVSASARLDGSMRFYAADLNERRRSSVSALRPRREGRFAAIAKGVVSRLLTLGARVGGVDVAVRSDVPGGIGLGSSQAIAVALTGALAALFDFDLTPTEVAQAAFHAERNFAQVNVGISSFLASALARPGQAMLVDTQQLDWSFVPLELNGAGMFGISTRAPAPMDSAEARQREDECEHCLEMLSGRHDGCCFQDFGEEDLAEGIGRVPEHARRYCLHIVRENARVMSMADALRRQDLSRAGRLLVESHESLSDLYEVSSPEVDWLVKHSQGIPGIYGARLAGGGTGTCAMVLALESVAPNLGAFLHEYERIFGFHPTLLSYRADEGVRIDLREAT